MDDRLMIMIMRNHQLSIIKNWHIKKMINNYKYPYYYPQPELLKDQYKYASQSLQLNLPLPGYSVKVPFNEKPTRFLNINRKHREIDYLRGMIQNKVDMEELHYQARISQMRRENQFNRQKLERLLSEQPRSIFEVPDKYADQAKTINQNIEKLSLKRLYNEKQRYLMDSVDKAKMQHTGRNSQSYNHIGTDDEDSINSQQQAEEKRKRLEDLDYIYKKKGAANTGNHFGTAPILKKQEQKVKQKLQKKRDEFQWVRRVRQARNKNFIEKDNQSVDSSRPSQDSQQKKNKQKQQQLRKQKQLQRNSKKSQMEVASNRPRQLSARNNRNLQSRQDQPMAQRQRTPLKSIKQQQKTVTNSEDISNMSQFSRYAEKNKILERKMPNKRMQNIFQREDENQSQRGTIPITLERRYRGRWKA